MGQKVTAATHEFPTPRMDWILGITVGVETAHWTATSGLDFEARS